MLNNYKIVYSNQAFIRISEQTLYTKIIPISMKQLTNRSIELEIHIPSMRSKTKLVAQDNT